MATIEFEGRTFAEKRFNRLQIVGDLSDLLGTPAIRIRAACGYSTNKGVEWGGKQHDVIEEAVERRLILDSASHRDSVCVLQKRGHT